MLVSFFQIDKYCRETIFGGFWKTTTKLCKLAYLAIKSPLDVLKKLLKKVVDFMEAGMQKAVIAIGRIITKIVAWAHPIPKYDTHEILDGIKFIQDLEFENATLTVKKKPKITFFPRTVDEISRIVKHAKNEGRRLRAVGMKHSWTDVFGDDGEYLMHLLPLEATDHTTFGRVGIQGVEVFLDNWGSELGSMEVSFP